MCRDKNGSSLAIGEYPRVLELLQSTICKATGWIFASLRVGVRRPAQRCCPVFVPVFPASTSLFTHYVVVRRLPHRGAILDGQGQCCEML